MTLKFKLQSLKPQLTETTHIKYYYMQIITHLFKTSNKLVLIYIRIGYEWYKISNIQINKYIISNQYIHTLPITHFIV